MLASPTLFKIRACKWCGGAGPSLEVAYLRGVRFRVLGSGPEAVRVEG